jgi:hypothetical protein
MGKITQSEIVEYVEKNRHTSLLSLHFTAERFCRTDRMAC